MICCSYRLSRLKKLLFQIQRTKMTWTLQMAEVKPDITANKTSVLFMSYVLYIYKLLKLSSLLSCTSLSPLKHEYVVCKVIKLQKIHSDTFFNFSQTTTVHARSYYTLTIQTVFMHVHLL